MSKYKMSQIKLQNLGIETKSMVQITDPVQIKKLIDMLDNNGFLPDGIEYKELNRLKITKEKFEEYDGDRFKFSELEPLLKFTSDKYHKYYLSHGKLPENVVTREEVNDNGQIVTKYYRTDYINYFLCDLEFYNCEMLSDEVIEAQLMVKNTESYKDIALSLSVLKWFLIIIMSIFVIAFIGGGF